MQKIEAVILDLGGVLLNLDYKKTEDAFTALGISHFAQLFTQHHAGQLFTDFETGKISPGDFIRSLKKESDKELNDEQVIGAWNAMLLDFPAERIALLKKLRGRFPLFLLSNTNAIHLPAFNQKLKGAYGIPSLDRLFDKAYYSHLIGLRKPFLAAYQAVIEENNLDPAATVFIDDTPGNVEAAEKAGLQAFLLKYPQTITELMEKVVTAANG